jgi:uncharacterized protein YprB with RNaseH-like and TPR domain
VQSNSLRDRIKSLKGAREPVAASQPGITVAERVQRLRVQDSAAQCPHGSVADISDVARQLAAEVLAPGVLLREWCVSATQRHGAVPLSSLWEVDARGLFANQPAAEDLLFIDTETTGLAGGSGTLAFLLGVVRVESDGLRFRQYFLTGFAGERDMLEHLSQWLRGKETLVSYNGKSFDGPLLATRHRLCGVPDGLSRLSHWDLVHPTRRAFAANWPDCRLTTVEQRLIGFQREGDLPGAEVPQVWFDYVRFGHTKYLPAVLQHNYWDLLSLVALLPALARAYTRPEEDGADALGVARHALRSGDEASAYRHLQAQRGRLSEAGLLELARLQRRRGAWADAVVLWQSLAQRQCVEAIEQLAKHYEHQQRDYIRALEMVDKLRPLASDAPALELRRQRLLRKLGT